MGEVEIRRQTLDDVEGVLDVMEAVAREGGLIATEYPFDRRARAEERRRSLERGDEFAAFVAVDGGRIVGSIGLHLAPYGVVDFGMALVATHRGRGLGRRLLDAGLDWARTVGAHKVALQVWPHNEQAIALYRGMGFVEEGRLRRHYRRRNGELWDAIVMGRALD